MLYQTSGSTVIGNSTFRRNNATDKGTFYVSNQGYFLMEDSDVSNNTAVIESSFLFSMNNPGFTYISVKSSFIYDNKAGSHLINLVYS